MLSQREETCRTCKNSKLRWSYPTDRERKCTLGYTARVNGYCKYKEPTLVKTFVDLLMLERQPLEVNDLIELSNPERVYPDLIDDEHIAYQWESELTASGYREYIKILSKYRVIKESNYEKLEPLGYTYGISEGGYVSKDLSTIVIETRSPYIGLAMQYRRGMEKAFIFNVLKLIDLNILEKWGI